jgi:VanZ family protein
MNEFHQLSIPPREFEWIDILLNSLGALVGVGLFSVWHKKRYPPSIENEQKHHKQ